MVLGTKEDLKSKFSSSAATEPIGSKVLVP